MCLNNLLSKLLIEEYKADVNSIDNYGLTPLHKASKLGHLDILKFLCRYVMEKNTLDKDGKTPLDLAVSECKWELVWFLEDTYGENWNFLNFIFPYWNYIFSITWVVTLIKQIPSELLS